jgi:tetratricopeptide (TPR) repeat protein
LQGGSSPRALAIATEAARVFPDAYELVSTKASLEMKLRYFNDAVVSYERAMKLHPSVEGQRGLATAQWRAGMRQQGVSGFKQLLAQFPRDAVTFQVYGTLLLEDGSPEDRPRAIELLKQAIALDASSVEPRYQLANAELGDGKPEQALQYLESAIKLDSQDSRLHFAISRVYRRLGRSSDADREMELYQKLKAAEQPAARNDSALGTQC